MGDPEGRLTDPFAGVRLVKPILLSGLCLVLGACAPAPTPTGAAPVSGQAVTPVTPAGSGPGDPAAIARGAAFATARCSGCHAVGAAGDSPMANAPVFREIDQRYPVQQLAEAFAEGIVTAHPAMPEFILSPQENQALIAYLENIQTSRRR